MQEEQQAFLGAISASTPSPPRSARGTAGDPVGVSAGEAPTPDSDDASLQLALRLQREVLSAARNDFHSLLAPMSSRRRNFAGTSCSRTAPSPLLARRCGPQPPECVCA